MLSIVPLDEAHRPWVLKRCAPPPNRPCIVLRGDLYDLEVLPGVIALNEGRPIGFVLYELHPQKGECLAVILHSPRNDFTVTAGLMRLVEINAKRHACKFVTAVLVAPEPELLAIFRRMGFALSALYPTQSRRKGVSPREVMEMQKMLEYSPRR